MLEIIELCRKYGVSISFDQFDVLNFINIRIFDRNSGRCFSRIFFMKSLIMWRNREMAVAFIQGYKEIGF